jgi:predicted ATP-grasp superfamily ATP-dependent carboligase
VARSLGRLGIPVYGVHADPASPAVASRYWRENHFWDLFKASQEQSLQWLLDLSRKIGQRPILIPTDDDSCLFVEDHAEILQEGFLFPIQRPQLARTLSNKKDMYSLCERYSVPTPRTVFPQSRADVEAFAPNCAFPVVLKGIDTAALQKRVGIKMVIIHDAETLLMRYDEMEAPDDPSLMLQEYIPGGGENVWMFDGYFDRQSDCTFGMTAQKLRQYPAYAGMTSLGVCAANVTLTGEVKRFMKLLSYRGIFDCDYKYNPLDGKHYLLDANPRLGCSFRLFVDSQGLDVVRAMYCDLTRQSMRVGELVAGRKWVAEPFDVVSSLRYWRDGNLKFADWLGSFKGVQEAQWFARDDMRPFWKLSQLAATHKSGKRY